MGSKYCDSGPEADWHKIVRSVQKCHIQLSIEGMGVRAPITVHTGMDSRNPLSFAMSIFQLTNERNVDEIAVLQKLQVDSLMSALDIMHKAVNESLTKSRDHAIK